MVLEHRPQFSKKEQKNNLISSLLHDLKITRNPGTQECWKFFVEHARCIAQVKHAMKKKK